MPTYTRKQVAEMLQVTPRTVSNWTRQGELKAIRKGRIVRYPQDALTAFMQAHESPSDNAR